MLTRAGAHLLADKARPFCFPGFRHFDAWRLFPEQGSSKAAQRGSPARFQDSRPRGCLSCAPIDIL